MFQPQLVCILALFASLPGFSLAGNILGRVALFKQHSVGANRTSLTWTSSNGVALVEQNSVSTNQSSSARTLSSRDALVVPITANQTSSVDEITKSPRNLTVYSLSPPVTAKSFLRKMASLPVEMCEEIMSEQWKLSSLSLLPVEMLPLVASVRNVTVDNVTTFAAVFRAFDKLKTINLKLLDWKTKDKQHLKLMVNVLVNITKKQLDYPPRIEGLNNLFNAVIDEDQVSKNQYDVIRVLLTTPSLLANIDPSAKYNYAIRYASKNGHADLVKLLLATGRVNPWEFRFEAIHMASKNGHSEVIQLLLSVPGVNTAYDNNYAIRMASSNGHAEVVQLLLEFGQADPSAEDNYAVCMASSNGNADVVKLLLKDARVDPTARENYAIKMSSSYGHFNVVKLLLEDGRVDPTADNSYAIRIAEKNNHRDVVKLLRAYCGVTPASRSNFTC